MFILDISLFFLSFLSECSNSSAESGSQELSGIASFNIPIEIPRNLGYQNELFKFLVIK